MPFSSGILTFDFTNAANKAYGSNQILVDAAPLRYAIYSGDVNQDGFTNLTDLVGINNGTANFLTGYIPTDVNGDNLVDLGDILISSNNASAFVQKIRP